jgi:hypothetical protein
VKWDAAASFAFASSCCVVYCVEAVWTCVHKSMVLWYVAEGGSSRKMQQSIVASRAAG